SQGDLFAPRPLAVQIAVSSAPVEAAIAREGPASDLAEPAPVEPSANANSGPVADRSQDTPRGSGWIGRDTSGWLR
ncbi:hypothetical protein, partial [Bradyrhizobium sp. SZCCHNRI2007]